MPNSAVASSQACVPRRSPRWIAASASTMVTLLISSTKEETEVKGMSNRSLGIGPMPTSSVLFR